MSESTKEKFGSFTEGSWFWGAIGILFGAIGCLIQPVWSFVAVGVILALDVARKRFFKERGILLYLTAHLGIFVVIGSVLFALWRVLPAPREPPSAGDIAAEIITKTTAPGATGKSTAAAQIADAVIAKISATVPHSTPPHQVLPPESLMDDVALARRGKILATQMSDVVDEWGMGPIPDQNTRETDVKRTRQYYHQKFRPLMIQADLVRRIIVKRLGPVRRDEATDKKFEQFFRNAIHEQEFDYDMAQAGAAAGYLRSICNELSRYAQINSDAAQD